MKNTILVFAVSAVALIATPATSRAADGKGGFFVNGNIGRSDLDNSAYDDTDTAYSINAGYRWAIAPAFAFGVEGGYTDPGSFKVNTASIPVFDPPLSSAKAQVDGWNLGVNAHWNVSDTWYLSGRTGLFNSEARVKYVTSGTTVQVGGHSNDWYAGVGVGYDFSDRFSLGLNYDRYNVDKSTANLDTDIVSAGAELRF